jgi:hypothetical protein
LFFFIGLHKEQLAKHFDRCFLSINRLRQRKSPFPVKRWIMDSGAFVEVTTHGSFRHDEREYVDQITRWSRCGELLAAVSQDYMCEAPALKKTGLTVREHQDLTVERYRNIRSLNKSGVYIMPVLQGRTAHDYVQHIKSYGRLIKHGSWVGVGSVCKRNGKPTEVLSILQSILHVRPDLQLHGFGLKLTAIADPGVRHLLSTADSNAWSFHARKNGRSSNAVEEALAYEKKVYQLFKQPTRAADLPFFLRTGA